MANSLLIALAVSAWYISGVAGVIFWWTKDFDFDTDDRAAAAFLGLFGPITWVLGIFVHGSFSMRRPPRVLFKRRGRNG